jgi:hypothetical protein
MNVTDVIRLYGPLRRISRVQEHELRAEGKGAQILSLISTDVGYNDLPEDERPSAADLVERGETSEEYSTNVLCLVAGTHVVNVEEVYATAVAVPEDLILEGNMLVWFGDDGLPES